MGRHTHSVVRDVDHLVCIGRYSLEIAAKKIDVERLALSRRRVAAYLVGDLDRHAGAAIGTWRNKTSRTATSAAVKAISRADDSKRDALYCSNSDVVWRLREKTIPVNFNGPREVMQMRGCLTRDQWPQHWLQRDR